MENIGPVVLFLLYMVISAWAKQKKNKRFQERADHYTEEDESAPAPVSKVESIFEQLKQELFQEEEEEILPPFFNEAKVNQPPMDIEEPPPVVEEAIFETPFVEGSASLKDDQRELEATLYKDMNVQAPPQVSGRSLETVLKPFSLVQQGIILHEIFGKPRALQDNDEWFHSHQ